MYVGETSVGKLCVDNFFYAKCVSAECPSAKCLSLKSLISELSSNQKSVHKCPTTKCFMIEMA